MKKMNCFCRTLIVCVSILSIECGENSNDKLEGEKINPFRNISSRAEPLNITDFVGSWRGSYTDKDYSFRLAIKLKLNIDGTYKKVFFSEGDPIDSAIGKIEIFVEKEDKTDNYGENRVTTYLHGIKLYFNTQWGSRTEIYKVQNSSLIPVICFDDSDNDIILLRE